MAAGDVASPKAMEIFLLISLCGEESRSAQRSRPPGQELLQDSSQSAAVKSKQDPSAGA